MKVFLIASIDFPVSRKLKHAGIPRVVLALAEELQALGVAVTVCCAAASDALGGGRLPTVSAPFLGALTWLRPATVLRPGRPD